MRLGCYARLARHPVCCFVSGVHPQQDRCSWAFPPGASARSRDCSCFSMLPRYIFQLNPDLDWIPVWTGGLTDRPHVPCWGGISLPPAQSQFKTFDCLHFAPPTWSWSHGSWWSQGGHGKRQSMQNVSYTCRYPSMVWWSGISSAVSPGGWLLVWIRQMIFWPGHFGVLLF